MIEKTPQKRRYNLYYIYKDDYEKHQLAPIEAENIRKKVFLKNFKKIKPNQNLIPLN